jgi:Mrp family chromosome partitioning ATPase
METLIDQLKNDFDFLMLDTPPVVAVTDACVLASKVDGVILVVAANTVQPDMARHAKELLQNANGQICGVVLNRVDIKNEYSYHYYYGNDR